MRFWWVVGLFLVLALADGFCFGDRRYTWQHALALTVWFLAGLAVAFWGGSL